MADADKRNVIQSSHNTVWYRSVGPTLEAKDSYTEKKAPEVPSAVSQARSNRRMMWEQGALACGTLLPIVSTRFAWLKELSQTEPLAATVSAFVRRSLT